MVIEPIIELCAAAHVILTVPDVQCHPLEMNMVVNTYSSSVYLINARLQSTKFLKREEIVKRDATDRHA